MHKEVEHRLTEVLLKYNLSITSLERRRSKLPAYVSSRQEVAYVLVKEFNFRRREVAEVLHCKKPHVTYLLSQYCANHKVPVPKRRTKDHPSFSIQKYILSHRPTLDPDVLLDLLLGLYQTGYRNGWHRADKRAKLGLKSFPGVPRVAPS